MRSAAPKNRLALRSARAGENIRTRPPISAPPPSARRRKTSASMLDGAARPQRPTLTPAPQLDPGRLLAPLQPAKKLLLAVSGGPDSMALMLLSARWSGRHIIPIGIATVDH